MFSLPPHPDLIEQQHWQTGEATAKSAAAWREQAIVQMTVQLFIDCNAMDQRPDSTAAIAELAHLSRLTIDAALTEARARLAIAEPPAQ